jgi:hypothetical protein
MHMRQAILADEHGDLMLFRDRVELANHLERLDIENGEYIFYASEGMVLLPKYGDTGTLDFVESSEVPDLALLAEHVDRYLHVAGHGAIHAHDVLRQPAGMFEIFHILERYKS